MFEEAVQDRDIVDEGAVQALKIADSVGARVAREQGVFARDGCVPDRDFVGKVASDRDLLFGERMR